MTEDTGAVMAQEELHGLLTSGIACLPQGVSVIEIVLPPPALVDLPGADLPGHGTSSDDPPHASLQGPGHTAGADVPLTVNSHRSGYGLGRLVYANPALEQMTGYTQQELQAGGLSLLLGQKAATTDVSALSEALTMRQPSTVKLQCTARRRRGSRDGSGRGGGAPPTTLPRTADPAPAIPPPSGASANVRRGSNGADGDEECVWMRVHVTPINQLPFMSAVWVPALSPPCMSPIHDAFSRSSSRELNTLRAQQSAGACGREGLSGGKASMPNLPNGAVLLPSSTVTASASDPQLSSAVDSQGGWTAQALSLPSGGSSASLQGIMAQLTGAGRQGMVHYMCVFEDINTRVNEEISWRLRDHALESCSEGIAIADPRRPDAPLIYVNDAFCQITGYSREEVLGRNCRFLQGRDTSRESVATLRSAVQAQRKATVELLNYKKNGEAFWNRLSITPVFNEAGEMVSYIGVQSDVTELIRRKEEEQRLLEAKVAAENATEAKSMFLANMSHEIRTPLNGMMATAQLLLASSLSPEQRELAETILESGNSLLGILGDILDFSKLDHGSIRLTREPVCLRRSIEACIEIVAPDAVKKGLALYYTSDEEAMSLALMADSIRLRQVLTNLLSNAVKFTERGEVHVDVKVEEAPASFAGPASAAPVASAADAAADEDPALPQITSPAGVADITTASPPVAAAQAGSAAVTSHPCVEDSTATAQPATWVGSAATTAGTPASAARAASGRRSGAPHPRFSFEEEEVARVVAQRVPTASQTGSPSTSGAHALASAAAGTRASEESARGDALGADGEPAAPVLPELTRRVHITVRDTGIGIPANLIGTLFQCFKQGSESMARRYGGTGLGLAISKRLSELMQGCCWVDSEGRGKGSVFHLCVPADFQVPPGTSPSDTSSAAALAGETPHVSASSTPCRTSTDESRGPMLPPASPAVADDALAAAVAAVPPAAGDDVGDWSCVARPAAAGASSYAESNSSGSGMPMGGGGPGGQPSGIHVRLGPFQVLQPDELQALEGRTVLVDLNHPGVAQQVAQSCRQLGMQPVIGTALPSPAASGGADGAATVPPADILIVSVEHAATTLKAGWKGRPVVAVGPRELLTPNLYPLVTMLPVPVIHARLANALVKSIVLLRWRPGKKAAGPKLTHQPISQAAIADFKTWRDRRPQGGGGGLSAAVLNPGGGSGLALLPQPAAMRGQYVGGQLAISGAAAAGAGAAGAGDTAGGAAFPGGFMRGPGGYDVPMMARRSSLDNSSLDRALVQQMLAVTQARTSQLAMQHNHSHIHNGSTALAAPPAGPAPGDTGAAQQPAGGTTGSSWRQHHPLANLQLPRPIPENTVLQEDAADSEHASRTRSEVRPPGLGGGALTPLLSPSPPPPPTAPPTPNSAAAVPPRILIAEDNKVNQKVVLKVLQQITGGVVADVVENGLEALRALEKKSYDIILMDIHMPEMDGLEATRRIMATYPPACRPRIIALSADTLQALHDRCREAGIEEFIVKPFRVEDLKRVMQTCKRLSNAGGAPHLPRAAGATGAAGGADAAGGQQGSGENGSALHSSVPAVTAQ